MYRYFISFAHAGGFGNTVMNLRVPIDQPAVIRDVEAALLREGAQAPVVVNFTLIPSATAN